jgi:hypothetical protein
MTALPSTRKCSLFLGALLLATFPAATFVSAADWTAGGSPDLEWSIAGNWSASPADENLVFGSAGLAAAAVTNTVDAAAVAPNVTFKSLSYIYDNSTLRHHTQIDDGVTLALTGGAGDYVLLVGGQRAATANNSNPVQYTTAAISGLGTLEINAAGKNILVANYRHTTAPLPGSEALLDMSGLAKFDANLATTQGVRPII